MKLHPKNIIVSGTPGAWGNMVAKVLAGQGWRILWPGQDLDVRNGMHYFQANGENIEVENIHRCIESDCDCSRYSAKLPTYFDAPYPGPVEFIQKFDGQPAVISGRCIAPCLKIWQPVADIVIDIQATMDEDLGAMTGEVGDRFSRDQLISIRQHQLDKYREHLKLFPKVFTISNAEVKDQRFDILNDFLNSVF